MIVDGPTLLLFAVKLGFTLAALLAIGLSLHSALGVTAPDKKAAGFSLIAIVSGLAAILMLARLALLNAQLGGSIPAAFDPSFFAWTWSALGPAAIAIVLGCSFAISAAAIGNRWLAAISAILFALGFGLTGHAAAADQALLVSTASVLHVLIAGFWIAAPVSLYPNSALADDALRQRLKRFSKYAVILVPVMFTLGLWLAWTLAGGLQPLIATIYGGLLSAKLAAAVLAVALGAINQRIITRLIDVDPVRGRKCLKSSLFLETALFVVAVTMISAATTITGPPADS